MPSIIDRSTVRDIKCFLCGYRLGEVMIVDGRRVMRRAPDCPPLGARRLEALRCPRCDGPVYFEGADAHLDWSLQLLRPSPAARPH